MGGGLGTLRCACVPHRGCPCPCLSPEPGRGGEQKEGSKVGVLEALNMTGRVQREKDKGADVIRKAQTLCEDARAS
jgi:hypothetical protein